MSSVVSCNSSARVFSVDSGVSSCCGIRSIRKLERLMAIGTLPWRSMIHPRRGGTGISWTRLLSDSS